jgi:hypothetical protein
MFDHYKPEARRRMNVMTRLHIRTAIAVLAVGIACTACQSATTGRPSNTPSRLPSTPSPSQAGVGPKLVGTVAISGAATIPATQFTTGAQLDAGQTQTAAPAGATCADYAHGFEHAPNVVPLSFVGPLIQTDGFHNIYVQATMATGFKGPGVYDSAHVPSLRGNAVEGIGTGATQVYTVFHAGDAGATVLTVNADGSGSLRIDHWDSDEVRQTAGSSQVSISGVVSWTCQD